MTTPADHHHDAPELAGTPANEPSAIEQLIAECPYDEREKLRGLLSLLECPSTPADTRQTRIDAVIARAARAPDAAGSLTTPQHHSSLTEAEAQLVDDWAENRAPDQAGVGRLLSALATPSDGRREDRIEQTLRAIETDEAERAQRLRLTPDRMGLIPRARVRLSELGFVAAVLVVVASMAFPVLSTMQTNTWAAQSTANLQQASLASSLFATDNDAFVPHVQRDRAAADAPVSWWTVGDPSQSHSAHLFSLISEGYLPGERLNAPGNPDAPDDGPDREAGDWADSNELSYSYRMFGSRPPRIVGMNRTILLADRSPLVLQHHAGERLDPTQNSRNHKGKGQHVALADGTVTFLSSSTVNGSDNIWLPASAERAGIVRLTGYERPSASNDQFVGP